MCHINTCMCRNAATTHVSLKMLLVLLPEKKHPWEQEENVPQNLPFCQKSALGWASKGGKSGQRYRHKFRYGCVQNGDAQRC